jgi:hypothetical protein
MRERRSELRIKMTDLNEDGSFGSQLKLQAQYFYCSFSKRTVS